MKFLSFLQQIQTCYQQTRSLSIFLRHGDRDLKATQNLGIDEPLNELGIEHSKQFGELLANINIYKIFTSPVQRCLETAKYIQKGYNRNLIIESSNLLGLPGIHIQNEKIAAKMFITHGNEGVYQMYIKNEGLEGFHEPRFIFQKLQEFIVQNISSKGINLYITHDILLAIWIFGYNGQVFPSIQSIHFLTGFIVKHYDQGEFEIVIH